MLGGATTLSSLPSTAMVPALCSAAMEAATGRNRPPERKASS